MHVNADGDLPLHVACRHQASLTVLRLLLESNVSTARTKNGNGRHHTAIGILCSQTNSETACKKPNYKSIFWQKIRLLLTAVSSSRQGHQGILPEHASHLLHAAVDVGAPDAVLKFCLDELVGDNHRRDSRGQYPIHVAVNIPKEPTAGIKPVFRMAKTSTIERLLQEFPESASAFDADNEPMGRYPIHTALRNDHDWFSGVRELARCAPDVLLVDDPEYGVKPFEMAKDVETTFQLLRRMPHALEASRRGSARCHQPEVHAPVAVGTLPLPEKVASEAFSLPEKDPVVSVPPVLSCADLQAVCRSPEAIFTDPADFEKTPLKEQRSVKKSVSSIGFAIAKAMMKPFYTSPTPQNHVSETAQNVDSRSAPDGPRSMSSASRDLKKSADSSKISSAPVATGGPAPVATVGRPRRSFEWRMATIVEQPFEDDEDDETDSTMDATESSSGDSGSRIEEAKPADSDSEAVKQSRMTSPEKSVEPLLTRNETPIDGDSCRASLLQRRNVFLDRLVRQQDTTQPSTLATTTVQTTVLKEAKDNPGEEIPVLLSKIEANEDPNSSDDENGDASQRAKAVREATFNEAKAIPEEEKATIQVISVANDDGDDDNDDVALTSNAALMSASPSAGTESNQSKATISDEKSLLRHVPDSNKDVNDRDEGSDSNGDTTPPVCAGVWQSKSYDKYKSLLATAKKDPRKGWRSDISVLY